MLSIITNLNGIPIANKAINNLGLVTNESKQSFGTNMQIKRRSG